MSYLVRLSRAADAYLQRLDRRTQERIERRLDQIAATPHDARFSKPLSNAAGVRASRVGGWRILFYVDEVTRGVEVTDIGPRGGSTGADEPPQSLAVRRSRTLLEMPC